MVVLARAIVPRVRCSDGAVQWMVAFQNAGEPCLMHRDGFPKHRGRSIVLPTFAIRRIALRPLNRDAFGRSGSMPMMVAQALG